MNVYRIIWDTTAEGPGHRAAIWLQGCSRHCKGCMLPETWPHQVRFEVDPAVIINRVSEAAEGITVLGGEPFEQPQDLLALLKTAKQRNLSTIVFTGFELAALQRRLPHFDRFESVMDVLVDGPYVASLRSFDVPMIGSRNQQFHFFTDRYTMADFPGNKIEIRLKKDGTVQFNGMGDFEQLKKQITGERDDF